ncbi:NAD-dependent epimerase/dehydratase family protein [Acinetobacter nosocomialis]|uniref:NAD-dependent epimerase/dehydratase family protein n=1 Tax=Acinetobacter nosocomialis TaxID=106654 RepID=UPI000D0B4F47|nr:NAD-dependent epimerase/dehydratase family protein [Acinetobacter nosocomialis]MBJ8464419.1 NAD-dependent epimerase/dehydratase family protein [Acinetobacter nosocomialis]MBP1487301.1 NAD-dependent epimerase/dehydratase family protein [Acinetobacter nosocomialis]MBP1497800.1 NAD-dependent epimerase/dehydratase family protein [Acinetobacter nosocomialis]MCG9290110.1 NAD-dependent epimerase/dehydratase family protein [Acinetobacter nosocomialis]MCU4553837.1 NAD-dependent epimerase/dehydratase
MFKNVLITGGAGFIGSNLALKLISKGYNVTVLDNLSPQIHGDNPQESSPLFLSIKDKVNFILGTVTSKSDWELALKDQDAIIHLAAETGTGQSMYEVQKYVDVNINGTALMLDLLVNNSYPVKKVIVASSRSIYGEGKYISKELGVVYPTQRTADYMDQKDFEVKYHGSSELELVATDEESKIHPSSVYGITKQNQEQMVLTVCSSMGIAGVAFRYQNVYGPGQSLKNPYTGILSIFSTQIKNGNKINIFEDGKESRDFVYIDDVVEATILGLEKEEANNQVFNVGTGIATSVITVADQLVKNYNIDVPITISGNYRLGDIRHNYADLTKIKKYLGFEPKVSFEEGIKKFTQWVNTQEIQEDRYQQSINEMKEKGLYK